MHREISTLRGWITALVMGLVGWLLTDPVEARAAQPRSGYSVAESRGGTGTVVRVLDEERLIEVTDLRVTEEGNRARLEVLGMGGRFWALIDRQSGALIERGEFEPIELPDTRSWQGNLHFFRAPAGAVEMFDQCSTIGTKLVHLLSADGAVVDVLKLPDGRAFGRAEQGVANGRAVLVALEQGIGDRDGRHTAVWRSEGNQHRYFHLPGLWNEWSLRCIDVTGDGVDEIVYTNKEAVVVASLAGEVLVNQRVAPDGFTAPPLYVRGRGAPEKGDIDFLINAIWRSDYSDRDDLLLYISFDRSTRRFAVEQRQSMALYDDFADFYVGPLGQVSPTYSTVSAMQAGVAGISGRSLMVRVADFAQDRKFDVHLWGGHVLWDGATAELRSGSSTHLLAGWNSSVWMIRWAPDVKP
jgi:hypothetical protein